MDEQEGQATDASPALSQQSTSGNGNNKGKPSRVLSCQMCQKRKTKCDKKFPCQNCLKVANIECKPSVPAPPRKRKKPNQDLRDRLELLESLFVTTGIGIPQLDGSGPRTASPQDNADVLDPEPFSSTTSLQDIEQEARAIQGATVVPSAGSAQNHNDNKGIHGRTGVMVQESGGTRFMDSEILATMYREVRQIRRMVEMESDQEDEYDCSDAGTPIEASALFAGVDALSAGTDANDLWPTRDKALFLWQVYLKRVNPLTKIIHVPTLQAYVGRSYEAVPGNIRALLFSIFLMATVTMTRDECQEVLRTPKEVEVEAFSKAVRMTLQRLNFIVTDNLAVLQALVIYFISLQGRSHRHTAWISNGLVIRIAQKMGLHRDGQKLGLTPFETEMRRRVWWQIIMLDAKYALLTGLNESVLPRGWDTEEPKNLNDSDIHPDAVEYFQDNPGPTEMVFCLMTASFAKIMANTPNFEAMIVSIENGHTPNETPEERAQHLEQMKQICLTLVGVLNRFCDPETGGEIHRLADYTRRHIIQKLKDFSKTAMEQPEYGVEIHNAVDNTFKLALCGLEHGEQLGATFRATGFDWWALLHFRLENLLFVASQLCKRTSGTLVDRAWKQVGDTFDLHPEFFDLSKSGHLLLSRVILRAWSLREAALLQQNQATPVTPSYVTRLRELLPFDTLTSGTRTPQIGNQHLDLPAAPPNPAPQPEPGLDMSMPLDLGSFNGLSALDTADIMPGHPQSSHMNYGLLPYYDVTSIDVDMAGVDPVWRDPMTNHMTGGMGSGGNEYMSGNGNWYTGG